MGTLAAAQVQPLLERLLRWGFIGREAWSLQSVVIEPGAFSL